MRIDRTKARERGPELIEGEGIDAGIDFVDAALIVGQRGILDDCFDVAILPPNDAPVTGRLRQFGGENRGGCGMLLMKTCEFRQSFGAH